jgi:flagellar capping protein FliD
MADSSSVSSSDLGGNRMSGLMSGLDTTALVEAMTSATLKRLETQKAKSQKLTWQQEGYRDIIDKLKTFQEKFTSLTSSDSMRLRSNLMKTKATSTDDRVKATSNSSASATSYTIKAATSAKTTSMKSNDAISSGAVSLDFTKTEKDKEYSVKITLDGNIKDVKFTGGENSVDSADNFLKAVNKAFENTMGTGQSFELDTATQTKLTFNDGDDGISHNFVVGYNKEAIGLSNDTSSRMSVSSKIGDIAFKGLELDPTTELYGFEINGVSFGFTKDATLSDIISEVNASDAGATMRFDQLSGRLSILASESGAGGELELVQTSGNLLNKLLGDDVTFGGSASLSKKMSYDSYGAVSADLDADMVKDIGLDGISDGTVYSLDLTIDGRAYTITADSSTFPKKEVDGKTESYKWTDFEKEFTKQIKEQYVSRGYKDETGKEPEDYFTGFTVTADSTNKITFTDNNKKIEIGTGTGFTADPKKANNVTDKLFTLNSVIANNNYNKENDVDIDGKEGIDPRTIDFKTMDNKTVTVKGSAADGSVTVRDLVDSGLFAFDSEGYLIAKQSISATGGDDEADAFMSVWFGGNNTTGFGDTAGHVAKTNYERGADATLTLKGEAGGDDVTYQNASDNFLVNGTTIDISGLGEFKAGYTSKNGVLDQEITIGVTKDTSAVKDLITGFVEGYNQLLDDVREYYDTTRPKSSGSYYEPLTDAQRKEMSKDEIDDWETQAKVGLLYNDKNLQKILDDLHGAMNSVVDGFSNAAAGIELTDSLLDNNKFKVNEEKLDNALAKYGDKLADYFTDPENGLASKLNKAIDGMISTSTSNTGYLVREAGVEGTTSALNSTMYNQLKNFQTMIDQIQERYKKQQDSYWKRFTALETYLAKMNSQSSVFAQ